MMGGNEQAVLDDRRAMAANAGDRTAAGAYLKDNLEYLMSVARWVANGVLDPDDLASEAITALLALWSKGTGPTSGPNAYVARSMRNRVIDEYRSPRSRVRSIIDADAELPPYIASLREVDLHREYGYVSTALRMLPDDQQYVLRAIVIEGRKPAALEVELDRPASSIYSLHRRAKLGVRRAMLRVILEEDAAAECRHAAQNLPESVPDSVDEAREAAGMPHIRACARCRSAWARFASISTLLGIAALLVVGDLVAPDSASAAEGDPRPRPRPRARDSRWPPGRRGRAAASLSLASIVVGGALIVAAVPGLVPVFAPAASLRLSVTSAVVDVGRAELTIQLALPETDGAIRLTLPRGMSVEGVPVGWTCSVEQTETTCLVEGEASGVFVLQDARGDEEGWYQLTLSARRGDQEVTGDARGGIATVPQNVNARIG